MYIGGGQLEKDEFIGRCDRNLKLVRTEFSFSQEKMALMLGISKKTLVEIEKERSSLGWAGSVVLCTVFSESRILNDVFPDGMFDEIHTIAFEKTEPNYRRSRSNRLWWQTIKQNDKYILEQNIVSQHYRVITRDLRVVASSFDMEELEHLMNENKGG